MAMPKVWLMEGEWSDRVSDRSSVEPALQVLQELNLIKLARRQINREDDLVQEFRRWGLKRHASYTLGYLALHGSPSSVYVRSEKVPLMHLAARLGEAGVDLTGRALHVGSCAVLRRTEGAQRLLDTTGLSLITGYTKNVDWIESMAFDLLLIDALTRYARPGDALRRVQSKYASLADLLGFTFLRPQ